MHLAAKVQKMDKDVKMQLKGINPQRLVELTRLMTDHEKDHMRESSRQRLGFPARIGFPTFDMRPHNLSPDHLWMHALTPNHHLADKLEKNSGGALFDVVKSALGVVMHHAGRVASHIRSVLPSPATLNHILSRIPIIGRLARTPVAAALAAVPHSGQPFLSAEQLVARGLRRSSGIPDIARMTQGTFPSSSFKLAKEVEENFGKEFTDLFFDKGKRTVQQITKGQHFGSGLSGMHHGFGGSLSAGSLSAGSLSGGIFHTGI